MATKTAIHHPVEKSEAEWRQQLSPEQFQVLRKHGTERAGTSPQIRRHFQVEFLTPDYS